MSIPLEIMQPTELPGRVTASTPWADNVVGATTTGDHLQPEDRPAEVLAALMPFLRQHAI